VLAFVEGDSKGMAEQVAWFDGKSPNVQYPFLLLEAETEAYRGRARAAQEFARRAAAAVAQASDLESGASYHLEASWRETVFGDVSDARKEAAAALDLAPQSEDVESWGAEVLARTGNATRARTLAQDLAKRFPRHTIIRRYWLPRIEAQIALAAKKPAEAIERLREAEPLEAGHVTIPTSEVKRIWPPVRGARPQPPFSKSWITPGWCGIASPARWLISAWPERSYCRATALKPRRRIKTSSLCGKMPTQTSPSSNKPNLNAPS
jgi:hypothetical protein